MIADPLRDAARDDAELTLERESSLARYIFEKRHFAPGVIRWKAFEPPSDLRLSTTLIDGLRRDEVVQIGQNTGQRRQPPRDLLAFGVITPATVENTTPQLTVDFDNTPVRHVSIVGWPPGLDEKDARMQLATLLADAAGKPHII